MQNVLARCSANLSFVHNRNANILLPVVEVELDVYTGTSNETTPLHFTGTPRGIEAVIATLSETLNSFDAIRASQPQVISEEEWLAKAEAEAKKVTSEDSPVVLSEEQIQAALESGKVMPFGGRPSDTDN